MLNKYALSLPQHLSMCRVTNIYRTPVSVVGTGDRKWIKRTMSLLSQSLHASGRQKTMKKVFSKWGEVLHGKKGQWSLIRRVPGTRWDERLLQTARSGKVTLIWMTRRAQFFSDRQTDHVRPVQAGLGIRRVHLRSNQWAGVLGCSKPGVKRQEVRVAGWVEARPGGVFRLQQVVGCSLNVMGSHCQVFSKSVT